MALREVNLIPPDILDRKEMRRHLTFWTVCLGIFLCPVFGFYFYQIGMAAVQKHRVSNVADVNRQLHRKAAKIKAIQAEIETVNQQLENLKTVLRPAIYSKILHKLAGNMNGYTWLDTLQIYRQKGPEETIRLQLRGYAASNGALGNFLNRLSNDPETERVVLKYAKEGMAKKRSDRADQKRYTRIEFEVECTISQGS